MCNPRNPEFASRKTGSAPGLKSALKSPPSGSNPPSIVRRAHTHGTTMYTFFIPFFAGYLDDQKAYEIRLRNSNISESLLLYGPGLAREDSFNLNNLSFAGPVVMGVGGNYISEIDKKNSPLCNRTQHYTCTLRTLGTHTQSKQYSNGGVSFHLQTVYMCTNASLAAAATICDA